MWTEEQDENRSPGERCETIWRTPAFHRGKGLACIHTVGWRRVTDERLGVWTPSPVL